MAVELGWTELVVAVVGALGTYLVARIGVKGQQDQTAANATAKLIENQGNRLDSLESSYNRMEERLRAAEAELREALRRLDREERRSEGLKYALEQALDALRDFADWAAGDRAGPPPDPDIDRLGRALED